MAKSPKPSVTNQANSSRRDFLISTSAAVGGAAVAGLPISRAAHAAGSDAIRLGLVGCGGRGTGAAVQALTAEPQARLVAVADAFKDRIDYALEAMANQADISRQIAVDEDHRFVGFDAYRQVIGADVDVVLLATPPHFRPRHLRECIEAGKHVFAEKPVAVDPAGVRSVLETTELAKARNLFIVSGLNWRYSPQMQEAVRRVRDRAIGDVVHLQAVRYSGGVWVKPRLPGMTEMEYQMRNWYYFTWLSGDFNVEQFVHQMDQVAWLMGDEYPVRCYSTGGRQARTGPEYGHIYDHFSSVFEYQGGAKLFSTTRHQSGCTNISETSAAGTRGRYRLIRSTHTIEGENPWQSSREREIDSHQLEHNAFFDALREGRTINNGEYMAKSTMMAILARMSAYTGTMLTWNQALQSELDLSPSSYTWDGIPPDSSVAIPGKTKFV
jgi:predicted dehydrogenase